jgi:hypothetical protein
MTTNYQDTAKINELAGNEPTRVWADLEKQFEIIRSEFEEMTLHVRQRNLAKLRDDVQDLLFTAEGMGFRAGFPVDEDHAEVCRSNMSKFDLTHADALLTQAKYDAQGIVTYFRERCQYNSEGILVTYYVTYSSKDQLDAEGRKMPKDKWLKSYLFSEPNYTPLDPLPIDAKNVGRGQTTCIQHYD